MELVQSQQMQQVLEVQPVKKNFYRSVARFEGPLLRRMRIVGWRMTWVNYLFICLKNRYMNILACYSIRKIIFLYCIIYHISTFLVLP